MGKNVRNAWNADGVPLSKRLVMGAASLALASAIWLPCVHLFFSPAAADLPEQGGGSRLARAMARRHVRMWTDPALKAREIDSMRASNAEWDFMGRTFLTLALANMALREPAKAPEYLRIIDDIIAETLRLEKEGGHEFFLMPYARAKPWVARPARSLFVDGEIALMLGARRFVREKEAYRPLLAQRIELIFNAMGRSPVLCAESYPDECWMFCNTMALAAVKIHDALDRQDHSAFFRRWLDTVRAKLIEPKTGLLHSTFTVDGRVLHGPEGSSIWVAAHCLQLIDETFAADQFRRARKELGRSFLGFGYAREWPPSWEHPAADIDSGPIVPVFEASAGSSGNGLIAVSAFGDRAFLGKLIASLNLGGFPAERDGALKFCASNQVGDAVALYALVCGPLWERVKQRSKP